MKWFFRFMVLLIFLVSIGFYFLKTENLFFWVKPEKIDYRYKFDSINHENSLLKEQIAWLEKDYEKSKKNVKVEQKILRKTIVKYIKEPEIIKQIERVEVATIQQMNNCDSVINAQFKYIEHLEVAISDHQTEIKSLLTENYKVNKELLIYKKSSKLNKKLATGIIAALLIGLIVK